MIREGHKKHRISYLIATGTRFEILVGEIKLFDTKGTALAKNVRDTNTSILTKEN
jgi:hypothetical protein